MKFILGKKIGMSQLFSQNGELIPVTLISTGPCKILQKKSKVKDGYSALQIGFEKQSKEKKSAGRGNFKYIKEFLINDEQGYSEGDLIDLSSFKEGDEVTVSGLSKGKGFQGGVKRWGMSGAPSSHGTKHNKRKIGSIGSSFPQRVIKGRKMPGRMGKKMITVKKLKITALDLEKKIIFIKGAVPGRRGTFLKICS